jgi:hypothetical protein
VESLQLWTIIMTDADPTARAPTKDELAAYCEWLFNEYRLLCIELWPTPVREAVEDLQVRHSPLPAAFPFNPVNTAAKHFHFPSDRAWQDVPKPSTRCRDVLAAVGLDDRNEDYQAELSARAGRWSGGAS